MFMCLHVSALPKVMYAVPCEAVAAPWEREAEAALWETRVFGGGCLYEYSDSVRLHAGCGASLFNRTASFRKILREKIEKDGGMGINDAATALCAAMLLKISMVDVRGLDEREQYLVERSWCGTGVMAGDQRKLNTNERPGERIGLVIYIAVVTPSGTRYRTGVTPHETIPQSIRKSSLSPGYSTDCAKVDLFRLYLYLWEDTPWDNTGEKSPFRHPGIRPYDCGATGPASPETHRHIHPNQRGIIDFTHVVFTHELSIIQVLSSIIHCRSLTGSGRIPVTPHQSPLTIYRSPFTAYLSLTAVHHSLLTVHQHYGGLS